MSAGDEKQEHLKKELLPGGWHDYYPSVLSAGRFLTPSLCLLHRLTPPFLLSSSPPPLLPQLWRNYDITLQPVGGRLHPLFNQAGFMSRCCAAASCSAGLCMDSTCWNTWLCTLIKVLLCCYCGAFCKVPYPVMWEDLAAEGHMTCLPSWKQPTTVTVIYSLFHTL